MQVVPKKKKRNERRGWTDGNLVLRGCYVGHVVCYVGIQLEPLVVVKRARNALEIERHIIGRFKIKIVQHLVKRNTLLNVLTEL